MGGKIFSSFSFKFHLSNEFSASLCCVFRSYRAVLYLKSFFPSFYLILHFPNWEMKRIDSIPTIGTINFENVIPFNTFPLKVGLSHLLTIMSVVSNLAYQYYHQPSYRPPSSILSTIIMILNFHPYWFSF